MVFSIYYQNVRGLRTKTVEFKRNIQLSNYDVVVLTETWLNDGIRTEELFSDVYTVWRRDRDCDVTGQTRGGGVLIAVKRVLAARARPEWHSTAEDTWVSINITKNKTKPPLSLHLCCLYLCAQNQGLSFSSQLSNFTDKVLSISTQHPNDKILILGDFNLSDIGWSCSSGYAYLSPMYNTANSDHIELVDMLTINDLCQYNPILNGLGRILDLVLCNEEVSVSCCLDPLVKEDSVYHQALICEPHFIYTTALKLRPRPFFCYNKGDYQNLCGELDAYDWDTAISEGSVDDAVELFNKVVSELRDKYIPQKSVRRKQYPPWYSSALLHIIKEKNYYHRKIKIYGNMADKNSFKVLRAREKRVEHECYLNYIMRVENSIKSNPKAFWSYIKSNKQHNSYPSCMTYMNTDITEGTNICNAFADFFNSNYLPPTSSCTTSSSSPSDHLAQVSTTDLSTIEISSLQILKLLKTVDCNKSAGPDGLHPMIFKRCAKSLCYPICLLFCRSISEGTVPSIWKSASVTPIHKKGPKRDICNYRPISKLCVLAKILEKIVHEQLYSALKNSFLHQQHGFLRGRSTTTNLISFIDFVTDHMESGSQVDSIYTDYSKAFDRIDHSILLDKLCAAGIKGNLLRWFASYVNRRCQTVVLNGYSSGVSPIPSGVPQGSILGPLLFIIFINDIGSCFTYSHFLLFADDMKIFTKIDKSSDALLLQSDLDRLHRYCTVNKLDLNVKKCFCISFTRSPNVLTYNYSINDQNLVRTDCIVDLGVTLDSKLLFDKHVEKITSKAMKMLGFLFRVTKDFSSLKTIKILYCSLVRSHLEYASQVWNPHYNKYVLLLEKLQRKFLKFINYKHRIVNSDYIDSCRQHHFLPLELRREAADLSLLLNIILSIVDSPSLLSRIGLTVPPSRSSRRNYLKLHVSPCATNYRKNSFLPRTMHVFNSTYSKNVDLFNIKQNTFKKLINSSFFK